MNKTVFGTVLVAFLVPSAASAGWWLSPSNQYCYTQAELDDCGSYSASGNVNGVLGEYYCADSWSFGIASPDVGGDVVGGIHSWNWDELSYDYEVGQYGDEEVSCYTPGQLAEVNFTETTGQTAELLEGFECAKDWTFEGDPPETVLYGSVNR